jgi:hypothetical protein
VSPYSVGMPPGLVKRTLEDLEVLGIAEKAADGEGRMLTTCAVELLKGTGVPSPKMHMNDQ